jgi:hypothetical protein
MIVKDPLVQDERLQFLLEFYSNIAKLLAKKALDARPSVAKPGLQATLYVSVCIMCAYQV